MIPKSKILINGTLAFQIPIYDSIKTLSRKFIKRKT